MDPSLSLRRWLHAQTRHGTATLMPKHGETPPRSLPYPESFSLVFPFQVRNDQSITDKRDCHHHDLDQIQLPPGTGLRSAFLGSYWIESHSNGIQPLSARNSCLLSNQLVSHKVKQEPGEDGGGRTNRIKHFFLKLYFRKV